MWELPDEPSVRDIHSAHPREWPSAANKAMTMRRRFAMGRRRGMMSEAFKYELAKELGFYDTVKRDGWGGITTRDAGNMVKRAIEIAESALAERTPNR